MGPQGVGAATMVGDAAVGAAAVPAGALLTLMLVTVTPSTAVAAAGDESDALSVLEMDVACAAEVVSMSTATYTDPPAPEAPWETYTAVSATPAAIAMLA